MSRKDYRSLAKALAEIRPNVGTGEREQWTSAVKAVADALAEENYLFDRERFYLACGK